MATENYEGIQELTIEDVSVLMEKGKSYGASWRKRGGVGAFMMLARKWDRIEQQCAAAGYDIFDVIAKGDPQIGAPDGLLDDIRDLRRYLLLVDAWMTKPRPQDQGSSGSNGTLPSASQAS